MESCHWLLPYITIKKTRNKAISLPGDLSVSGRQGWSRWQPDSLLTWIFPFIAGRYPGQRLAAEYLPPMKVVSEFVRRGDERGAERGAAKIMEMRSWKWLPTGDSLGSKDHKFQNWILGLILFCYYKALEKKVQSLCVLRMWSAKSCDLSKPFDLIVLSRALHLIAWTSFVRGYEAF